MLAVYELTLKNETHSKMSGLNFRFKCQKQDCFFQAKRFTMFSAFYLYEVWSLSRSFIKLQV